MTYCLIVRRICEGGNRRPGPAPLPRDSQEFQSSGKASARKFILKMIFKIIYSCCA